MIKVIKVIINLNHLITQKQTIAMIKLYGIIIVVSDQKQFEKEIGIKKIQINLKIIINNIYKPVLFSKLNHGIMNIFYIAHNYY